MEKKKTLSAQDVLKGSKRLNQKTEEINDLISILRGVIPWRPGVSMDEARRAEYPAFRHGGDDYFLVFQENVSNVNVSLQGRRGVHSEMAMSRFDAMQLESAHVVELHARLDDLMEAVLQAFPHARREKLELLASQAR